VGSFSVQQPEPTPLQLFPTNPATRPLATLKALTGTVDWDRVTKAVDWDQVFQIQGEYLRASLERATQFTQRYFEVVQTVTSAAADAARRQAKKAA
jgi:hypothetical protein